jgi:serine/threonine-protein kinase
MVTGQPPFDGKSSGDVVAAHIRDRAPFASTLAPDVPAVLEGVIARCLEKDPEDRYQSMGELVHALANVDFDKLAVNATTTYAVLPPYAPTVAARRQHPTTLTSANGHRPRTTSASSRWGVTFAVGVIAASLFAVGASVTGYEELASITTDYQPSPATMPAERAAPASKPDQPVPSTTRAPEPPAVAAEPSPPDPPLAATPQVAEPPAVALDEPPPRSEVKRAKKKARGKPAVSRRKQQEAPNRDDIPSKPRDSRYVDRGD